MKRIFLLLLALAWGSVNAQQSNEELYFRVHYMPETRYNQTIQQSTHTSIKYAASEEIIQRLKEHGYDNPTVINTQSKIEALFKTGKLNDQQDFPLTIEFVNTTSSDGKKTIPDGMVIYGHGSPDRLPSFDSIGGEGLNVEFKQGVLQAMQSLFSQLSFPERKVKVGESFSHETPLSIPIAGITLDLAITTNYTLLSITNGVAEMDISQVYTMKSTFQDSQHSINAAGRGSGKMMYNISREYLTRYQVDMEMEANMILEHFGLDLIVKSGITQIIEIANN